MQYHIVISSDEDFATVSRKLLDANLTIIEMKQAVKQTGAKRSSSLSNAAEEVLAKFENVGDALRTGELKKPNTSGTQFKIVMDSLIDAGLVKRIAYGHYKRIA